MFTRVPGELGRRSYGWRVELGENMPCSVPATLWKDDYVGGFSGLGNMTTEKLLHMTQGIKKYFQQKE
jgi:hypothetical protein